jgi:L-amino acid N-acyltransferase YncA
MTTELRIRVAVPDDAASVAPIYAPYVTRTAVSFEEVPPTADAVRERIARTLERHAWIVAETDAGIVGYAYASEHHPRAAYRWSVDVAIYLDVSFHRRGVGRRLYTALFSLLARQRYVNALALIVLPNAPSVGLHEATGFVRAGLHRAVGYKLGAWQDIGVFMRTLREPPHWPEEPLPLAALGRPEIEAALAP